IAVYDVLLRYVPNLRTEGSEIVVIVLAVVEHFALLCGPQTVERIHEGGLASTGTAHQGDELARGNADRNVIEQRYIVIARLLEVVCIDANKITLVVLRQLVTFVNQLVWSNTDLITQLEETIGRELVVDVDVIGTVQVKDTIGASLSYHARMMGRNLRVRQDQGVVRFSPDGQFSASQFDRLHRGQ